MHSDVTCGYKSVAGYFKEKYGIEPDEIDDFLDTDLRWLFLNYVGPEEYAVTDENRDSKLAYGDTDMRMMAEIETVKEVLDFPRFKPEWYEFPDFAAARQKFEDRAIMITAPWQGYTMVCEMFDAFGMERALVYSMERLDLVEAFAKRQHETIMELLEYIFKLAKGYIDIVWLGDDFADNRMTLITPSVLREYFFPYLKIQAKYIHDNGYKFQYHSCGAIHDIYPDLIDAGVDAHEVFQITCRNMEPERIANDFGGKIALHGGIPCPMLVNGAQDEVRAAVRRNIDAFKDKGGYVVSNAHIIEGIKGENLLAMFDEADRYC